MSLRNDIVAWVRDKMPQSNKAQSSHARTPMPRRDQRLGSVFDSETFLKLPPFPMSYTSMYGVTWLETVSTTCILNLKQETFRRGLQWTPKWTSKCPKCNSVFTGKKPLDACPKCDKDPDDYFTLLGKLANNDGSIDEVQDGMLNTNSATTKMIAPDPKEYERMMPFIEKCNQAGLSLIEVLKKMDEDLNIVDEGFMVVRKEYDMVDGVMTENGWEYANPKHEEAGLLPGDILRSNVLEVWRGSPKIMRKVIDQNNNVGGRWYKCLNCGDIGEKDNWGQDSLSVDDMPRLEPNDRGNMMCPKCGFLMHDVIYFEMLTEMGMIRKFYIEGEVIHRHKFSTSTGYGQPPILTVYPHQAALIYGIAYIRDFLEQRKAPQGVIQIVSANVRKAMKRWKEEAKKRKEDKQHVPVMFVEPEGTGFGGTGQVKWVPIMQTLADMEWTAARNECRERIAYFYGVSPKFMSDESGQKSNNDGMGLVVSNRTIETEQNIFCSILDELMPMLKINNWKLGPKPTEDRDIMKETEIDQLKIQNMQMLYNMGFEVDIDANDNWQFWKPVISTEQQGQLTELINAKMGLEAQIEQMKNMPEEPVQSYQPSKTVQSGDGTKGKQEPANRGITKSQDIIKGDDCLLCEKLDVDDWEFVKSCTDRDFPIYSYEVDDIYDVAKSVVKRRGEYCVVHGSPQKEGSKVDKPKGTTIKSYPDPKRAHAMHYAIRMSQAGKSEVKKSQPPADFMKASIWYPADLLTWVYRHWKDAIRKAFNYGKVPLGGKVPADTGVKTWKTCSECDTSLTRKSHQAMNGKTIPADDSFIVNYSLDTSNNPTDIEEMEPGDSAWGTNCRCTAVRQAAKDYITEFSKGDGESKPFQMKGSRAEGRTKTDAKQKPKSGSTYTPGQTEEYECDVCGQSFPSKEALGGHKQTAHKGGSAEETGTDAPGLDITSVESELKRVNTLLQAFFISVAGSHRPSNTMQQRKEY